MKIRATQAIMECLLEQEVDTVFGYPGGTILNLYDELYNYQDKIRHVLTAHEQGASHAADGYARSTGKVGVCFATSGPGATNLTTGIATAYMDSSPVVFITCNVSENLIGKDSFQEVDITGISMPITKCNYLVNGPRRPWPTCCGRPSPSPAPAAPGPVLVDIAKNVTAAEADYEPLPLDQHANHGRLGAMLRRASHDLKTPEPDAGDIQTLLDLIEGARKPLVLVGGGVIRSKGAVPQFRTFIERLNAPVASTIMGGGACPGNDPQFTGMIGMHGTVSAAWAVERCDLLVCIGAASPTALRPTPSVLHRRRRLSTLTLTTRRSIRTSALTMPLFPMRRPSSKRLCRISRRQSMTHGARRLPNGRQSSTMCRRTMRALSIRTSCSARLRRRPRRTPLSQPTLVSTSFGVHSTTAASTFVSS